jgi:hypothetical protein
VEDSTLKYVTATIGALLVVFGAFLALMLIPVLLLPSLAESKAALIALYAVSIPLAIAAGVVSFRSTLKVYAKKEGLKSPGDVAAPLDKRAS